METTKSKILDLSAKKLINVDDLDKLDEIQELYLHWNKIYDISGMINVTNLRKLHLGNNNIAKIKGFDNFINLENLYIGQNKITEIKNISHLKKLKILALNDNYIVEIKGLDNLINLQVLWLNSNQLYKTTGLSNLNNLEKLDLSFNEITEINGLDNLTNLRDLDLDSNQITKISGLNNLINLRSLDLNSNYIKKIEGLENLTNLEYLYLHSNVIKELPLSLCNLRNLRHFSYYGNPIEYIPLPVQRWLQRFDKNSTMVYKDNQNIHNHHIQTSFRRSLENILRDKELLTPDAVKTEILNNDVLTEQTKREILNYCDDQSEHTTYLITYADLLVYVWSRISKSINKTDLCEVLNQEISDGLCMCFTGRLTRLLNCLSGFYDDIELQISDSEQITNIIMSLKKKYDGHDLHDQVRIELLDRQYSTEVINEWLGYL